MARYSLQYFDGEYSQDLIIIGYNIKVENIERRNSKLDDLVISGEIESVRIPFGEHPRLVKVSEANGNS